MQTIEPSPDPEVNPAGGASNTTTGTKIPPIKSPRRSLKAKEAASGSQTTRERGSSTMNSRIPENAEGEWDRRPSTSVQATLSDVEPRPGTRMSMATNDLFRFTTYTHGKRKGKKGVKKMESQDNKKDGILAKMQETPQPICTYESLPPGEPEP